MMVTMSVEQASLKLRANWRTPSAAPPTSCPSPICMVASIGCFLVRIENVWERRAIRKGRAGVRGGVERSEIMLQKSGWDRGSERARRRASIALLPPKYCLSRLEFPVTLCWADLVDKPWPHRLDSEAPHVDECTSPLLTNFKMWELQEKWHQTGKEKHGQFMKRCAADVTALLVSFVVEASLFPHFCSLVSARGVLTLSSSSFSCSSLAPEHGRMSLPRSRGHNNISFKSRYFVLAGTSLSYWKDEASYRKSSKAHGKVLE